MLLNSFFTISDLQMDEAAAKATLSINAGHKIFDGHFPGQPVVPGVCMMQMVKELVENITGKKTNLVKAHDLKFLAVIDPVKNNNIQATLNYTTDSGKSVTVQAAFFKDELMHFKFKGQFDFL